jgi:bifunctional non-homologous end joining protein LigD
MEQPLPDWLEPMAATLTEERFADPAWSFERKLDGIRVLAFKKGRDVSLFSRNRLSLTESYPAVVKAIAALPVKDAIFDGEATGAWGRQGRADYHVFDVLWLNGRKVTSLPLDDRRKLLDGIRFQSPVARVRALDVKAGGEPPWERACREGWEGVIAKRRDSPYEHRRSRHWLKMKCEATQELVIGGFTDPRGARVGLGALLVGYFEGASSSGRGKARDFVFAGKVGTGFDTALLLDLRKRLDALAVPAPPFTKGTGLPRLGAHWTRPEIVVQVSFIEWTVHGKLRHPRLLGVRVDKAATEVVREKS